MPNGSRPCYKRWFSDEVIVGRNLVTLDDPAIMA